MLGIESVGQCNRDPAERILRIAQGLVAKLQQAAQRPAGQHAILQFHGNAVCAHFGNRGLTWIGGRTDRFQCGCLVAQYQGLPVADKDVVLAAILHHDFDANQFTEAADQLIALIEQIVRGLATGRIADQPNLLVQIGNLGGVSVDLIDVAGNLIVDIRVQAGQILAHRPELIGHRLSRADQLLPRSRVGRGICHRLHAGKQRLHQRRQTCGLIGQQVVDLGDLRVLRCQRLVGRLRLIQLRCQELIITAGDVHGLHAVTEKANTRGVNATARRRLHGLPAITSGIHVCRVVSGSHQRRLCGIQAAEAGIKHAVRHKFCPVIKLLIKFASAPPWAAIFYLTATALNIEARMPNLFCILYDFVCMASKWTRKFAS